MCEFFLIAMVVSDLVPFTIVGGNFSLIECSVEVLFDVSADGISVCRFADSWLSY